MHHLQTSFTYKSISYEMGVRHLHTPEHCVHSHPFSMPCFHIKHIKHKPLSWQGLNLVALTCSVFLWGAFHMYLMSDERSMSYVILSDVFNSPRVLLRCEVTPCENYRGHTLQVECVQDIVPNWVARCLLAVMFWEDRWLWSHESHQLPELVQYRRAVMFTEKTPLFPLI